MTDSEKLEALEEVLRDDTACSLKIVRKIKQLTVLVHIALAFSSLSLGMLIGLILKAVF